MFNSAFVLLLLSILMIGHAFATPAGYFKLSNYDRSAEFYYAVTISNSNGKKIDRYAFRTEADAVRAQKAGRDAMNTVANACKDSDTNCLAQARTQGIKEVRRIWYPQATSDQQRVFNKVF